MILIVAVLVGVVCGIIRAKIGRIAYQSIQIKHVWLVIAAYIPQFFMFFFPPTRSAISDQYLSMLLVLSQVLLLIFIWVNRKIPGGWLMGLGLLMNFLAIVSNGGMMPLTPENAQHLLPEGSSITLNIGERVGTSKDILLEKSTTNLWFLSDIFILPSWFHYPLAFSPGDVFLSLGVFWLFWELGNPKRSTDTEVVPV
jgi:hypothetical protein